MIRFDIGEHAHALFTSREQANLSSVAGEGSDQGAIARRHLREALGLRRLARGHQVHGAVVVTVREELDQAGLSGAARERPLIGPARGEKSTLPADGQATSIPEVGAMVLAADCLPVLLCSANAIAALHAGWRGMAAGVLEQGVRTLAEADGQARDGDGVVAIIGPGAGLCCYEVGEEVHGALGGNHRERRRIDLRAIARDRLLAAGVADVRDVDLCTICDERFFSHRREGVRAGRQAGIAWLS
jgi:YfiH family protein